MIKLLLLLLIGFILYPVFKMWLLMRRMRNNVREANRRMNEAFGNQDNTHNSRNQQRNNRTNYDTQGEYAEFETVEGARRQSTTTSHIQHEDQVTDAEFEQL